MSIQITEAAQRDAEDLGGVFYEAVQNGTSRHYSEEQRDAWAPEVPELAGWQARLADQKVWIARKDGLNIGFISLSPQDHIDFFFVRPDYMGQGVSNLLYETLIKFARSQGLVILTSDASYLARSFFLKKGWEEVTEQEVEIRGVALTNFKMEVRLERL